MSDRVDRNYCRLGAIVPPHMMESWSLPSLLSMLFMIFYSISPTLIYYVITSTLFDRHCQFYCQYSEKIYCVSVSYHSVCLRCTSATQLLRFSYLFASFHHYFQTWNCILKPTFIMRFVLCPSQATMQPRRNSYSSTVAAYKSRKRTYLWSLSSRTRLVKVSWRCQWTDQLQRLKILNSRIGES